MRPISEMIFDEGPNSYELSYGLPGQSLLENKNYCDRRIYGVGNNFYQRMFHDEMVKKSCQGLKSGFTKMQESENNDENLYKYYNRHASGSIGKRTKRHGAIDLILEDMPHLKEFAR